MKFWDTVQAEDGMYWFVICHLHAWALTTAAMLCMFNSELIVERELHWVVLFPFFILFSRQGSAPQDTWHT